MLSCSCDIEDCEFWYEPPDDFKKLEAKRRKRCCSCNNLIDIGSLCLNFPRFRDSLTDIEERIWGDTVQLADWHMCEECGEIFLNLQDLGYCLYLGGPIREDLEDYWDLTGFIPNIKEA